ncbi:hypothetical protein KVR01_000956 [Diaporthe batatas]|uniref:uncharacterized protein n=1 Tax=Diaporthe batatas TaxID=748121 RepID=UPI001D047B2F|nr:uncharacterized protein KVR01_000956 [Diaporthe batatas]KAG8170211.1 hypothetical protein KVR01_000956 [Diaporthe batatas]
MASSSGGRGQGGPAASPAPLSAKATNDPVLRNTLRYTISAREYALLHRYVLSKSRQLKKRVPTVETVNRIMNGDAGTSADRKAKAKSKDAGAPVDMTVADVGSTSAGVNAGAGAILGADDYNARAVRHSIRVFATTAVALKAWGVVAARFMGQKQDPKLKKQPAYKSPVFRLSLSLSSILLLYRLLFRFFTRLRLHILDASAEPFRKRNPRTADTLTSPYAPAVGASLAGLALGIYPAEQLRVTVAIYTMFRALEFGWNFAEDGGLVWGREKNGRMKKRPWWFGSWLLQPFAFGQLLHSFVFDLDCFPTAYGDFILKNSSAYLHKRPKDYPPGLKWPGTREVVDSLGQMARLNWPPYISPTLFPNKEETLPPTLTNISPLTAPAHPLITALSCATLHPQDPSCSRTFLTFWLRSFPPLTRFFLLVYSAFLIPKYKALYNFPFTTLNKLVMNALRMSTFVTGSIASAWASICFFQAWLPRSFLATQRFFLGGFLAGFWAWVERRQGRGVFLYSARASVDSLWKVGVKRRWWKAMRAGDVWVFVLAVMITGAVYEQDARAVREDSWRKGISWMRGQGFRDWSVESEEDLSDEDEQQPEDQDGQSDDDSQFVESVEFVERPA